jgi:2'-5' RNA ligase
LIGEMSSVDSSDSASLEELERFRSLRWLRNHWSRPVGRRAYYWYLAFEDSPELHALARKCQEAISFPYYDPTPPCDLHLTLDRIAFDGDITLDQLAAIEAAAIRACREMPPLEITIGSLGGTRGAIGFTASPAQPIRDLRDTLRAAVLSVYPDAPVMLSGFHPHVTIAYANSDGVPVSEVVAAAEKLNATARVDVTIHQGVLVLLERRQRSYVWQAVSRIPLAG